MQITIPEALKAELKSGLDALFKLLQSIDQRIEERTNFGALLRFDTAQTAIVDFDAAKVLHGVEISSIGVVSVGGGLEISLGDNVLPRNDQLGVLGGDPFMPARAGDYFTQEDVKRFSLRGSGGAGTALIRVRGIRITGNRGPRHA